MRHWDLRLNGEWVGEILAMAMVIDESRPEPMCAFTDRAGLPVATIFPNEELKVIERDPTAPQLRKSELAALIAEAESLAASDNHAGAVERLIKAVKVLASGPERAQ